MLQLPYKTFSMNRIANNYEMFLLFFLEMCSLESHRGTGLKVKISYTRKTTLNWCVFTPFSTLEGHIFSSSCKAGFNLI